MSTNELDRLGAFLGAVRSGDGNSRQSRSGRSRLERCHSSAHVGHCRVHVAFGLSIFPIDGVRGSHESGAYVSRTLRARYRLLLALLLPSPATWTGLESRADR